MKINEFVEELKKIDIKITEDQLNLLKKYTDYLTEYNNHTNLTRITSLEDIYLKHFYDSLTLYKEINLNEIDNVLDIGSGAGFPGIVLKILFPNLNITLLDSNSKKTTFLNLIIKHLGLNNIVAIHQRAEIFAKDNLEKYTLVTSRAVANLVTLTELSLPFVKIGGYFVALKGDYNNEPNADKAIKILGGKIVNINEFFLPIEDSKRTIIKVQKVTNTPSGYPRDYDKILKKPLK